MSGWENSDRRSRLPADWPSIRQRVLERDHHRCQWRMSDGSKCGWKATDVDHIEHGDDDAYDNLQALCSWHHRRKSGHEGGAARQAKRRAVIQRFARKPAPHPGSLL